MTNKLVVVINSLKVPKIKKILLYEMKFLVPNYICPQNPWLGVYRAQIPVLSVLYPQLNLLNPPPPTKFLGTPLLLQVCKWVLSNIRWPCVDICISAVAFHLLGLQSKVLAVKLKKLPPVRNCFTLVMTNKLVVIINSLKVPKIKKILLYEMKFLVPNYSCLQNPWLGGLPPPDPRSLCPQLNLLSPPPEQNSWVRHWLIIYFTWLIKAINMEMAHN
jgi:hypothetical protein